jgi:hypothetical protein
MPLKATSGRMPHRVKMKRFGQPARPLASEQLQGLALQSGREREETQVRLPSARLHDLVHFFLLLFEKQEVAEDIEEALELEDFLPEVAGPVSGFALRISRAANDLPRIAPPVERQEMRFLPRQPGRHVNLVRIGGKMHQRPLLEIEHRRARVPVLFVLPHRVPPTLARAGILQPDGRHRQPVHREHHVQRPVVPRMARHLPGHGQSVFSKLLQDFVVRAVRGLEIREAERLSVKLEPVPQHMQRAFGVQFLDQRAEHHCLQPVRVKPPHLAPELRLRVRDECEHLRREQPPFLVPLRIAAGLPAAARRNDFLNVDLESALCGLAEHLLCGVYKYYCRQN